MYTVLVMSCHPDDMEIACAGTLLKCKERGDRVVVLCDFFFSGLCWVLCLLCFWW